MTGSTKKSLLILSIILLPIAAIILLIIVSLFFTPFQMSGESMTPAYKNGEYLLTRNYNKKELLKRGDVVIYKSTKSPYKDYIKRIIGLPGEKIMISGGKVYINDQILEEKYLTEDTKTYGGTFIPDGQLQPIPQGNYIVLGDNRPYSTDSREEGFVPTESIISIVQTCYWNCK